MKTMTEPSNKKQFVKNSTQSKGLQRTVCCFFLIFCSFPATIALAQNGQLIFRSGFEAGSTLNQTGANHADITGIDTSVSGPNDWVKNLEGNKHISRFGIQYGSGDASSRIANIVADPLNPENKVLQFWCKGPVKGKARIQSNVSGRRDLKEWYCKSKLFLHPDLGASTKHDGAIGTASTLNATPPHLVYDRRVLEQSQLGEIPHVSV